jgi:glycosyltransferase involved in cell wall biosynthesis
MKVVFLYTELAGYFLKCCEELSKTAEVHIIHWPVNKEAPFKFSFPQGVAASEKTGFAVQDLRQHVQDISPDIIICSGWVDKQYLKITRDYFGKIPTVVTCDTRWKGSPRQYLAILLGRIFLKRIFSNIWVPGRAQENYARKLGFRTEQIHHGFYACDLETFNSVYERFREKKRAAFPRRFLYVGRYYEFKGISGLWTAFMNVQHTHPSEWELWCFGTGSVNPVSHPKIKHFGFVQPADMPRYLGEAGVFILPSLYEPWGVAVQEFAAAGYPLLLSDAVGSREAFLRETENGLMFRAGNVSQLERALKKIMELSDKELFLKAEKSHHLAQAVSPANWAATVTQIKNEFPQK